METMTNVQFKTFMRLIIDDLTEIKDIASEEIKNEKIQHIIDTLQLSLED